MGRVSRVSENENFNQKREWQNRHPLIFLSYLFPIPNSVMADYKTKVGNPEQHNLPHKEVAVLTHSESAL